MRTQQQKTLLTIALAVIMLAGFAYVTLKYVKPLLAVAEQGNSLTTCFVIYYADGSQQVIEAPNKLEVYTATLASGGREITGIGVSTRITLDTGGRTVTAWNGRVTRRMEIYKAGVSSPLTSSTGTYSDSGSAWASGEQKSIGVSVISATQIEQAIKQYAGTGTYTIQVVDNVQLTVTASGETQTLQGTGVATLTIEYKNYSAMSITVTTVIAPMNAPV